MLPRNATPEAKSQKKRRKNLQKKKGNCNILFSTFLAQNAIQAEEEDKSAGAQDYKICNLRRGHNRKYKSFRFITSTPNAPSCHRAEIIKGLPATWSGCCQARADDRTLWFGTSWLQDLAWGASPQCRLWVVAGLESLPESLNWLLRLANGKCGAASVILFGQFPPTWTGYSAAVKHFGASVFTFQMVFLLFSFFSYQIRYASFGFSFPLHLLSQPRATER